MLTVKVITVGTLKETYWRDAMAEYEKRLSGFCRPEIVVLREERLPSDPTEAQIERALEMEGQSILAAMPSRSYKIAMCVEGKQLSSEELADRLGQIEQTSGTLCLVIGSSFGLSEKVKAVCDMRLSVSRMTFPHQMLRVMLLEILYRAYSIRHGSRYHK